MSAHDEPVDAAPAPDPTAASVRRVRGLILDALAGEGLLLDEPAHAALRDAAMARGEALVPRALRSLGLDAAGALRAGVRSLGLGDAVLPRVLGFGWQQADALAALAGVPAKARDEVAELGALFNLGIALFDYLCDRFPARAAVLLDRVSAAALDAHLDGAPADPRAAPRDDAGPTFDAAVDVLVVLIAEFFARSRALGDGEARHELGRLIRSMYRGERFAVEVRLDRARPTLAVWRALGRKSALPMWTMLVLGLIARPPVDEVERLRLRTAAALAGDAVWIVDDLADLVEDWRAGSWSRPFWLLARSPCAVPDDAPAAAAIDRLIDAGIAAAEARRLAGRLARLGRLASVDHPLALSARATVQSWALAIAA